MSENFDDIMNKISNLLKKYLKDEIGNVELAFKKTDGSSGFYANLYNYNGERIPLSINDEDDDIIYDSFESLYQTMTADTDKHKWNRAKVTLNSDGELNIKFEWDQELEDELKKLAKEYDPRWDESLTPEEKEKKYKEMVKNGELPDLSKINITYEDKKDE